MADILSLIGRDSELFLDDISANEKELSRVIGQSSFLVLGGAGSIGQAVVKELFKRNPKRLHVVDLSENNLVELVRDLRSSYGYTDGEFKTFALDIGSTVYDAFFESDGEYDYVLNLSALKHVRSEKDPFTLMRLVDVNVLNTEKTLVQCIGKGVKKYFCVSTDKAANPVNMMGGSKRIMEYYLAKYSSQIQISTARFANVAFSDGSLLHGFNQRIEKRQPIVAPYDVKRYFVTPKESGELCLMSCIFGKNNDIFFPKLSHELNLITFADIAKRYLHQKKLVPHVCDSEDEARNIAAHGPEEGTWPCLFTQSDTTGEKDFEEFYTEEETIDFDSFVKLGVIKWSGELEEAKVESFSNGIAEMKQRGKWTKEELVDLFHLVLPNFGHRETGKYLDSKM